jgi:Fe-S cluster assembly protein SufD
VIEHYVSLNETRHFTGARLTMNVAANAQLHHIKLAFENAQSHHFAHNDIVLGRMPRRTATASCSAGGAAPQHQHAA